MKKIYKVYEPCIWWGCSDKLIGVYDTREQAEAVAHGMWADLGRYIVEEEVSES